MKARLTTKQEAHMPRAGEDESTDDDGDVTTSRRAQDEARPNEAGR